MQCILFLNVRFTEATALPAATARTMGLNKKSPTANGSAASMIPENCKKVLTLTNIIVTSSFTVTSNPNTNKVMRSLDAKDRRESNTDLL